MSPPGTEVGAEGPIVLNSRHHPSPYQHGYSEHDFGGTTSDACHMTDVSVEDFVWWCVYSMCMCSCSHVYRPTDMYCSNGMYCSLNLYCSPGLY